MQVIFARIIAHRLLNKAVWFFDCIVFFVLFCSVYIPMQKKKTEKKGKNPIEIYSHVYLNAMIRKHEREMCRSHRCERIKIVRLSN